MSAVVTKQTRRGAADPSRSLPLSYSRARRGATLAAPVAVPMTMSYVFARLRRRVRPRTAYNAGFTAYWLGWCGAFPLWVLGPRRVAAVLTGGRPPTGPQIAALALPVAGAAVTQLWPYRKEVDARTAAVMVGTAAVNAVGEELLWRAVPLEVFSGDKVRGAAWPLLGFALWHLAPQIVLPSRIGRLPFVVGAAAVGAASTAAAWHGHGLRHVLLPHTLTDACGVTPARFRLTG